MLEFNRQKLLENVNSLIQQSGMKIGEVESSVGISAGYLSRLSKKESDASPGVDLVWKLAQLFNVSVDALIEGDFSMATDNMRYFSKFLYMLKEQVDANLIEWDTILRREVDLALHGEEPGLFLVRDCDDTDNIAMYGIKTHQIVSQKSNLSNGEVKKPEALIRTRKLSDWEMGKHWCTDSIRIRSEYYPDNKVWMIGDGFRCKLDSDTRMYLFQMAGDLVDQVQPKDENGNIRTCTVPFYEIYFEKWQVGPDYSSNDFPPEESDYCWNVIPICNTCANASNLASSIDMLYKALARHASDLKLNPIVKDAINAFMNDCTELPFK